MSAMLSADFRVKRGDFQLTPRFEAPLSGVTALFGPSGAGKSMLLSALAGVRKIDAGHIVLGDKKLDDTVADIHTPPHLRGIGLVFQDARLFPHLNVRGNLDYAVRRAAGQRALLSLDEAAAQFDLKALLDRPVRNLSGGERSRVALARALLSAPDLLLLDEPFAALDGIRRASFLASLRDIHERFALPMIVVTHQIDDAATLADYIVGLRNGVVIACGALSEIATSPETQGLLDPRDSGAAIPASALTHSGLARGGAVWVRADHVLLATEEPRGLSARNIWQGQIRTMTKEPGGSALVHVDTSTGALLSRVTPQAVEDLALAEGAAVWAIVKAHSA